MKNDNDTWPEVQLLNEIVYHYCSADEFAKPQPMISLWVGFTNGLPSKELITSDVESELDFEYLLDLEDDGIFFYCSMAQKVSQLALIAKHKRSSNQDSICILC